MDRKKLEFIITGILIIIFLLFLVSTVKKRSKKSSEEISQEKPVEKIVAQPNVSSGIETVKLNWGRDPFVLNPQKPIKKGEFLLTAVIWDELKPHAIINNEVVVAGQEIDEYRVIKINKDNVVLQKGDQELTIRLYK